MSFEQIQFQVQKEQLDQKLAVQKLGQEFMISINPNSQYDQLGPHISRENIGVIILQANPWTGCMEDIFVQMGTRYLEKSRQNEKDLNICDRSLYLYDYKLSEFLMDFPENIYLILNLNFFAPSECPDMSQPIPGGPQYWTGLFLIEKLMRTLNIEWVDLYGYDPLLSKLSESFILQLIRKIMIYKQISASKPRLKPFMNQFTNN